MPWPASLQWLLDRLSGSSPSAAPKGHDIYLPPEHPPMDQAASLRTLTDRMDALMNGPNEAPTAMAMPPPPQSPAAPMMPRQAQPSVSDDAMAQAAALARRNRAMSGGR